MKRIAVLIASITLGIAGAAAQTRALPDDAERGVMQHVQGNVVTVDGRTIQLAPGATIRDRNNLIIVPTALPGEGALAEYTLDPGGQVARVWLLTPEEASRQKPRR